MTIQDTLTYKQKLINNAVKIINDNFGSDTARLYRDFYTSKDEKTIIESCKELLSELVGPVNASRQLRQLYK